MKKVVAVLLSASFILAGTACTKKDDGDGKGMLSKKTDDSSVTETTDAPDVSTSESSSEETTEETTTAPNGLQDVLVYDDSIGAIDMHVENHWMAYGLANPNKQDDPYGYGAVASVRASFDWLYTNGYGHDDLNQYLYSMFQENLKRYEDEYTVAKEKLITDAAAGVYPEYNEIFFFASEPTRCDDLYCSFFIADDKSDEYIKCYNLKTSTCEEIKFDDVVTDKNAFNGLLKAYLANKGFDAPAIEKYGAQVESGTIPFVLTYDGIFVFLAEGTHAHRVKISAIAHDDMFNLGYFGTTPKNYVLTADHESKIYWDVNGDGKTDEITLSAPEGNYYEYDEMTIMVNDVGTTITHDVSPDLEGSYDHEMYLAHTGNTNYIIATTYIEDDYSIQLIFRLKDDLTAEFVSQHFGYFKYKPYNPDNMQLACVSQFIGTSYRQATYALDEASGTFVAESTCFERFGPVLVTKQEISGVNAYSGSKVVLGKGTSVQVVGFDFEAKEVYLKSLYEDENLDEKIVVSITQKGEYSYLIDGKDEQDLFIGLMYAG